jgi:hypothetical protein
MRILAKTTILAASATLAFATAYAANDTQETTPYSNSPAQAHGEQHKKNRAPMKAKKSKDGGTARGQGSGVSETNKSEMAGQQAADKREAMPHKDPKPGGTPQ